MYTATAAFYDLIYSSFKDYATEVAQLVSLLRAKNPGCASILDIACGTGEHAARLAAHGFTVDGVDLDPAFIRIAREKHPAGRFFQADMSDVHLPYRYDAVLCLFSSIGYLQTLDRVNAAFACFSEHLAPGGVLVVEPWFPPGVLDPARVTTNVAEAGGTRIVRTSRVEVDGEQSRLVFDYEIADVSGTRTAREVHHLGLFPTADLLSAFRRVGLEADYDPQGLCGRGLFVASAGKQLPAGR